MITKEQVVEKLRDVIDPELGVNVVELGLVYKIELTENSPRVHIEMTLTTPGCPLASMFDRMVKDALFTLEDGFVPEKDVVITLVWDPPWVPDFMSDMAKAELGF
ncbi:MAG TPA: metal-sulfur cluster assembly factor [Patescibacteria group bacterium]|nr:metal-sulfur cluster assembly factor [Patescibacteria group bacterium]